MRRLTVKQKKLLDKWYEQNNIKDEPGIAVCNVVQDLLPDELWDELQEVNNTEVLYQEVNCYITDKA